MSKLVELQVPLSSPKATFQRGSSAWKILVSQFLMFAFVGVFGTAAHYAVLVLFVQLFDVHTVLASSFGFFAGASVNYSLNYIYTFRSTSRHWVALPKFFAIAAVGFLINGAIMYLGVSYLAVHYLFVQVFSTAVVLVFNFAGNRIWTFSDSASHGDRSGDKAHRVGKRRIGAF